MRSAASPLRFLHPALLCVVCAELFAASALVALTALGHTECKLAQELFDKGNVDDVQQVDCDGGPQLHAKVTGTETYQIKATLLDDGGWRDTSCTCPDGERTQGKCKHVVAVLIKAATDGGSDPHAGNPQPAATISSKCNGDVEAVGEVVAARNAKSARKLPTWMMGSAVPQAQKTAGASAPAKAAAMVSKVAPAKRKTAKSGEEDSHEANKLPAKEAPRKRRKAPAAPATAAEPQTDGPSALSDNNDLGLDLLEEDLAATSNAVPPMPNSPASAPPGSGPRKGLMSVTGKPVVSLAERMKATNEPSTGCQLDMHAKPSPQSDTSTGAGPLGEKAKQGLVSKDSSQSSAVPDTPEPSPPASRASVLRGTSCRQDRSGRPAAAIDDSDSDSDEEPAVKFAKKLQARLLGVPCPGTVVNGSGNNRLESVTANANEHPANSHRTRSIPADASKKAGHCADSDDDRTLGEMLDRRQGQVGDTAGRDVRVIDRLDPPHPRRARGKSPQASASSATARSAPFMTTNKPVMSLADRRKAIYGE